MNINYETISKFLCDGTLNQIAFSKNDIKFYFEANENFQIKLTKISSVTIEPRSFDCPSGMSMHTQILWLVDEAVSYTHLPALSKLIDGQNYKNALDVGCGEGRLCRFLAQKGIKATGIDPTKSLIARARELDSAGQYLSLIHI